jgi:hypothetical protein
MQRDANHDALDFAFFDQRREGLEIDLATLAIELAARKREGAFVVRNGETDSFASHVECEGLHRAWNCSGSSGDETEPKSKHERNEIKKREPKKLPTIAIRAWAQPIWRRSGWFKLSWAFC